MKKAFYAVAVIAILALSLIPACTAAAPGPTPASPTPPPQKITLRMIDPWKPGHFIVDQVTVITNEISKRSQGRLEIIRTGGAEIIPALDQLTACGKGSIDMVAAYQGYYSGTVPEGNILGLPVVAWNWDNTVKLTNGVADDLDKIYQKKANVKCLLLSMVPMGNYIFTKQKSVSKVADMRGLKIRSAGGMDAKLIEALGAVPTNVTSSEIYTAAERGVIDGGLRSASAVIDWREYEVWKYVVTTPILFNTIGSMWINLDTFNKLPSDLQKIMIDTITEMTPGCVTHFRDIETNALKEIASKGVKLVDLEPGEVVKWQTMPSQPAQDWFLQQCPESGKQLIEKVKAATK